MKTDTQKKVLITGASSGIGHEVAQFLTERGWEVWGTSRDTSRLQPRPHFHAVKMDLTCDESIRNAFSCASRDAGGFNVLINNAGSGVFGPTTSVTSELAREQFQVMVHGPIELIRLAVPHMLQHHNGIIINISSLAGTFPIPYMGAYNAAKAALSSYSHCLRLELAQTAIRIVDVKPADINTNFHASTNRVIVMPSDADSTFLAAVWDAQQRNMATAPPPSRVAEIIVRIINNPNPPASITVGNFLQSKAGPWISRIVPERLQDFFLSRLYGLP